VNFCRQASLDGDETRSLVGVTQPRHWRSPIYALDRVTPRHSASLTAAAAAADAAGPPSEPDNFTAVLRRLTAQCTPTGAVQRARWRYRLRLYG